MRRDEVKQLLMVLEQTYPNFKVKNPTEMIDTWMMFLEDEDGGQIALALKNFVKTDTSGFAPSINQLITMANKKNEVTYPSDAEAWSEVLMALKRSSYYAEEEFAKLPELSQKAVGSADMLRSWATDSSFNESVVGSHFRKSYNNLVNRQKEYDAMIPEMRQQCEKLSVLQNETIKLLKGDLNNG